MAAGGHPIGRRCSSPGDSAAMRCRRQARLLDSGKLTPLSTSQQKRYSNGTTADHAVALHQLARVGESWPDLSGTSTPNTKGLRSSSKHQYSIGTFNSSSQESSWAYQDGDELLHPAETGHSKRSSPSLELQLSSPSSVKASSVFLTNANTAMESCSSVGLSTTASAPSSQRSHMSTASLAYTAVVPPPAARHVSSGNAAAMTTPIRLAPPPKSQLPGTGPGKCGLARPRTSTSSSSAKKRVAAAAAAAEADSQSWIQHSSATSATPQPMQWGLEWQSSQATCPISLCLSDGVFLSEEAADADADSSISTGLHGASPDAEMTPVLGGGRRVRFTGVGARHRGTPSTPRPMREGSCSTDGGESSSSLSVNPSTTTEMIGGAGEAMYGGFDEFAAAHAASPHLSPVKTSSGLPSLLSPPLAPVDGKPALRLYYRRETGNLRSCIVPELLPAASAKPLRGIPASGEESRSSSARRGSLPGHFHSPFPSSSTQTLTSRRSSKPAVFPGGGSAGGPPSAASYATTPVQARLKPALRHTSRYSDRPVDSTASPPLENSFSRDGSAGLVAHLEAGLQWLCREYQARRWSRRRSASGAGSTSAAVFPCCDDSLSPKGFRARRRSRAGTGQLSTAEKLLIGLSFSTIAVLCIILIVFASP